MPLMEIPLSHWVAFFENFRRVHEGWLIILEVLKNGAIETVIRNLPLRDVEVELRDDRKHLIEISAGDEAGECMTHLVRAPWRVELQTTDEGAHQVVKIDSEGDERTLIRFRVTALPENIEGIWRKALLSS